MAVDEAARRTEAEAAASRALWRHADFNKFWFGQSISVLGSELTLLALPLTAIIMLNAGPAQLGYLAGASSVSTLVLSLFAGVIVDRVRRKPIMIGADLGRALAIGAIPVLAATGALTIGWLYVAALVSGALGVMFDVPRYAYVPTLLDENQLLAGNSRVQATESAGGIVGSSAAGALISVVRPAYVLVADAVSFVVSAVSLMLIRTPEPMPERGPSGDTGSVRTVLIDIVEGVKTTFINRYSGPLALNSAGANFGAMVVLTLFILYARTDLHLSTIWIGVIYACGSVGGVVGGVLTNLVVRRIGFGRATMVSMLAYRALCIAPFIRGPEWFEVSSLSLIWFVTVVGVVMSNVCQGTLQQYVIPNRLLGRVGAASRMLGLGVLPLAALVAGYLGANLGVHGAIIVGAAILPLPLLWVILSPVPRLRHLADAAKEDDAPPVVRESG